VKQDSAAAAGDARLLDRLSEIACQAARAILAIGSDALTVRLKPDQSPVTAGDDAAQAIILAGLARVMPGVPVVSEEASEHPTAPLDASQFVLVDPLDGTREFVAQRDEYTVNIAVVRAGVPAIGVIAAPALGSLWRGAADGAERLRLGDFTGGVQEKHAIRTRAWNRRHPAAVVSRSHADAATAAFIARFEPIERVVCGSALKFCRVAEGAADVYPRLAATSEWDIAAGHALVVAAGGTMAAPDGESLAYGCAAELFRVPGFIAWGDPTRALPR
jgi:3'(2'), 5'-bisphosphate nucleotidase